MAQNTPPDGGGSILDKVSLPVIGGIAAVAVIGIIIAGVALSSGNGDDNETASATGSTGGISTAVSTGTEGATATPGGPTATTISGGLQTERPTAVATADLTQPTAEAENLTSISGRMTIPKFGVDAPLTYRAVGLDGAMPNPDGPDDIAYYDFSAWPGKGGQPAGGNIVLAGHVDSGSEACQNGSVPPPCEAVLWDLNNLVPGDEIHVVVDGMRYLYSVTSNEPVDAASGPWDQIVSATNTPSMTVITCGGDFNRETGEYTHRQVVKATYVGAEPA